MNDPITIRRVERGELHRDDLYAASARMGDVLARLLDAHVPLLLDDNGALDVGRLCGIIAKTFIVASSESPEWATAWARTALGGSHGADSGALMSNARIVLRDAPAPIIE